MQHWMMSCVVLCAIFACGSTVHAQSENQDEQKQGEFDHWQDKPTWPWSKHRQPTYELPAVDVIGEVDNSYREEERIGAYGQPRWTAHRRFPTTRIYVRPQGEIDFEQWLIVKTPRDGYSSWITESEIEIGLPKRFQFDYYLITTSKGGSKTTIDHGLELRYALADWGQLPGNPTLYFEYVVQEDRADKIETKLLLGGEIAPGWHWGSNFVWEHTLGDTHEDELEVTVAVAHSLIDEKLSLGLEGKFAIATEDGMRSTWNEDIHIGPSLQWRPTKAIHVDFAPLFGVTGDSRAAEVYLIAGIEF